MEACLLGPTKPLKPVRRAGQPGLALMRRMGQPQRVLTLYEQASRMAAKPRQTMAGEFLRQSNWYKLRQA